MAQSNEMDKELSKPQFKVGDRFFSHYVMDWGTVVKVGNTVRDSVHGVTGSKLPDTTWYTVVTDKHGDRDLLDDAHGDWDMARMVPPHIAKRFGYGDDPNPPVATELSPLRPAGTARLRITPKGVERMPKEGN